MLKYDILNSKKISSLFICLFIDNTEVYLSLYDAPHEEIHQQDEPTFEHIDKVQALLFDP
jgi:hypothetical protein